ncbi:hypothetical protein SIN8267_00160 [Sinobacterium norvegicum]|uniref:Putative gamma-glutamylcyclotransferase n=1 Tax=Sinobacterium norvegicum TaxID=1641715 RepID=A0ABM9ABU7_9GAMM|nr:gamma-glutamylcyclotransferase family protein [Sinobacterium norvegicum]CAH0990077.1 hypothetical protein SIN8267_00160 [Sinobacterium norvegicum]
MKKIFAYGLLQYPDLLNALIGKALPIASASLLDYRRRSIDHPAVSTIAMAVEEPGHRIEGVVISQVDAQSLAILDAFEMLDEGWYSRRSVTVQMDDGTEQQAELYCVGALAAGNIGGDWPEEQFYQANYQHYIEHIIPDFLQTLAS